MRLLKLSKRLVVANKKHTLKMTLITYLLYKLELVSGPFTRVFQITALKIFNFVRKTAIKFLFCSKCFARDFTVI